MPKQKTRKSLAKRIKLTRNDKVVAMKPGQNHFNGKESGNTRRAKRKDIKLPVNVKKIKRSLA